MWSADEISAFMHHPVCIIASFYLYNCRVVDLYRSSQLGVIAVRLNFISFITFFLLLVVEVGDCDRSMDLREK